MTRKSPNLPISRQVKKPTNSLIRPFCLCPHTVSHTTSRNLVPRGSRVIVSMPRPPHSLGGLRAGDGRIRWERRRPRRVQGGARTHWGRGRRLRREEGRRRPPLPTPHPPLSERAVSDPSRRDPVHVATLVYVATRHVATRFTSQTGPRCDFTQKIIFSDTMFRRYS